MLNCVYFNFILFFLLYSVLFLFFYIISNFYFILFYSLIWKTLIILYVSVLRVNYKSIEFYKIQSFMLVNINFNNKNVQQLFQIYILVLFYF